MNRTTTGRDDVGAMVDKDMGAALISARVVGTKVGKETGAAVGAKVDGVGVGSDKGTVAVSVMVGFTRIRPGYVRISCACMALVAAANCAAMMLGFALFIVNIYETATPEASSERRLKDDAEYPLTAEVGTEKMLVTAATNAL